MEMIDEAIADAMAEETVKKEFKFSDAVKDFYRNEAKVAISLDEYVELKFKERDLSSLLRALTSKCSISYNDNLYFDSYSEVTDTFKALYPEAYDELLKQAREKE